MRRCPRRRPRRPRCATRCRTGSPSSGSTPTARSAARALCAAANRAPALSLWPNPAARRRRGRGGVAARGGRDRRPRRGHRGAARGRPARRGGLATRSPSGAVRADRTRGRADRPARRRAAGHAGARSLRGSRRQDRGARSERCAGDGGRLPSSAREGARGARCAAWASRPRSSPRTAAPTAAARSTASSSMPPAAAWASWRAVPTHAGAGRPRTPRSSLPSRSSSSRTPGELLSPGGELHYAVCTLNPAGERGDRARGRPRGPRRAAHLARRGRRRLLRSPPDLTRPGQSPRSCAHPGSGPHSAGLTPTVRTWHRPLHATATPLSMPIVLARVTSRGRATDIRLRAGTPRKRAWLSEWSARGQARAPGVRPALCGPDPVRCTIAPAVASRRTTSGARGPARGDDS